MLHSGLPPNGLASDLVKLQWTKEPPKEIAVSVNQELKLDCLANGEPKPMMRWERLDSSMGPSRVRNAVQFSHSNEHMGKNQLMQQPASEYRTQKLGFRLTRIHQQMDGDVCVRLCLALSNLSSWSRQTIACHPAN
mgnify:CR=1 FL=1